MYNYDIGLVLSGGGAKGAYQAGVFEALFELGISDRISVVSGTSIGALNAMIFAMNDREVWRNSWEEISYSIFTQRDEKTRGRRSIKLVRNAEEPGIKDDILQTITQNDMGILSQSAVSDYIKEQVRMDLFRSSGRTVYACAYNMDEGKPEYFKLNDYPDEEIIRILLASSAIPFVFKPVQIEGDYYADGGVVNPFYAERNVDNLPMQPLKDHRCDAIIAVCLSQGQKADLTGFADTPVVEICPSTPLEPVKGVGTLDFSSGSIRQRMELGYRDTLVALAPMVIGVLKGSSLAEMAEAYQSKNANSESGKRDFVKHADRAEK